MRDAATMVALFVRLAAALTAAIGVIVLVGWVFSLPLLKSVLPGAVEMKANTAVGLVLAGCALFIFGDRPSPPLQRLAQASALAVGALGLATLGEYLFGWQLGIDEFLVKDTEAAYNLFRGRMSPISAAAFVIIGSALAVMRHRSWLKAAKSAAGLPRRLDRQATPIVGGHLGPSRLELLRSDSVTVRAIAASWG